MPGAPDVSAGLGLWLPCMVVTLGAAALVDWHRFVWSR